MKKLNFYPFCILLMFAFSLAISGCSAPAEENKINTAASRSVLNRTGDTPIGYGSINTHVDGTEVDKVNLWSRVDDIRTAYYDLNEGSLVAIIEDNDPYYLVRSIQDSTKIGYCLKGFVNYSNEAPISLGIGTVKTFIDGEEYKEAQIWDSPSPGSGKSMIYTLSKGEKVAVLGKSLDYYLVQEIKEEKRKGYVGINHVVLER